MLQNQLKINLFLFRRFVDAVSKIDRPFQILRNHIRMSETQHPVYPVFLTELLHPALRNLPLLVSFLYRDIIHTFPPLVFVSANYIYILQYHARRVNAG